MRDPTDHFSGSDDIPPDVVRYVTGECSAEAGAAFEARLAVDHALAAQVELAERIWAASQHATTRRDLDRVWTSLRARLDEQNVERPATPQLKRLGIGLAGLQRTSRLAAIVAAVLMIALPTSIVWWLKERSTEAVPTVQIPVREYATLPGERAELRLGDGTHVILGAASRLTVQGDFRGGGPRELWLEGQAHFDVVHDPRRPFRVHTRLGDAEDLGTEFVVTTYPETGGMQVAVAAGVVALRAAATPQKTVLRAGDLGRLDSAGVARVERGIDLTAQLAWTRGELVFRRTALRQAIPELERWYGIRIRLASPRLGQLPISASFFDQAPAEAVAFVAAAVGARLSRGVGDSVFTLNSR